MSAREAQVEVNYSNFKALEVTQDGRLLTVALNRPERLNAVNGDVHRELEDIFRMLAYDQSVGAIILTGNGKAFCAGGDVKMFAENAQSNEPQPVNSPVASAKRILNDYLEVEQPIIAAVNGPAMGLGATLALFADIVLMADEAIIADTHVNVGIVAGDGGTVAWPMLLPLNRAKYYLLTGARLGGEEAWRIGLVNEHMPLADLMPRARELGHQLANMAPWAVRLTKVSLNKAMREKVQNDMDGSLALEMWTFKTEDHKEASIAFVERRAPTFTGR
jgi:enoyl-CoA hydratase